MNNFFDENIIWILIILFVVFSLSSTSKTKVFAIREEEKEKVDYLFRNKKRSRPNKLVY